MRMAISDLENDAIFLAMLSESTPMETTPGHLLGQLGMRDVVETDERLIIEMDNRAPVVVGPARAEATIVRAGKRLIVTAVGASHAQAHSRDSATPPRR
jgi:hypothetical protein